MTDYVRRSDELTTFEQQQHQQQQQNHYYNNNYNNYNQTSPEAMQTIREAYEENIGQLTGAVAKLIEQVLDHGLTAEEVVMAIEETGFAPKPSPAYLRRILQNWAETGVTVSRIRHLAAPNRALKWWRD